MKTLFIGAWAIAAALATASYGGPAESNPTAKTFEDYCKDENLPADQREFVIAVLHSFVTTDCAEPQRRIDAGEMLQLGDPVVTDITPIAGFKNLTYFIAFRHSISDLSPLAKLTSLEYLNLDGNLIEDLSPLAGLTNLEAIRLRFNRVRDLSPLKGLTKLKSLNVKNNYISDFSALAQLTDLKRLAIGFYSADFDDSCEFQRIQSTGLKESLKHLKKLESFRANHLDLTDTKDLEALPNLRVVELDCNLIEETSLLDSLQDAYSIKLSFNPIKQLKSTKRNENLMSLSLRGLGLKDVAFLKNYPSLRELNLDHNEIFDASPIGELANLADLDARHNRIADASFLTKLPNLNTVYLEHNAIAKFPFTEISPDTGFIWLSDNALTDISGVESLRNLHELAIGTNPIKDISPLAELDKDLYLYLEMSHTDVTDLSPLQGVNLRGFIMDHSNFSALDQIPAFPKLGVLSLKGNGITSIAGMVDKFGDPGWLDVSDNPITDLTELKKFKNFAELRIARTKVANLDGLSHLNIVNELDISGLGISSLAPIANIRGIRDFIAANNQIADLSPLAKNGQYLGPVNLKGNKITSVASLGGSYWLRHAMDLNLADNPLGTTVAKTAENCPANTMAIAVNTWCQQKQPERSQWIKISDGQRIRRAFAKDRARRSGYHHGFTHSKRY